MDENQIGFLKEWLKKGMLSSDTEGLDNFWLMTLFLLNKH